MEQQLYDAIRADDVARVEDCFRRGVDVNNLVIVSSQPLLSHCLSIYLSFLISLTLLVLPHLTVCLFLSLLLSLPFISLSNYLLGPTYPPYPTMCV